VTGGGKGDLSELAPPTEVKGFEEGWTGDLVVRNGCGWKRALKKKGTKNL